jgi:SAM-dependent methyltransferase
MVGSHKTDQDTYKRNLEFWDRAWSPVKAPYTQMPDLPYIQALPERLASRGVSTVLDLGCGSGWLAVFLARAGFRVTGVDCAAHAVELAAKWAAQEPDLALELIAADITNMPFEQGRFDACVANSVFEHLTEELACKTLVDLKRVLKPGGVLFGCFDKVGTGPGEFYRLDDGTQVYTDKGREGMMLHYFDEAALKKLLADWKIESMETLESGSRIVYAVA